jgi:hypothetical protein
VYDLEVMYRPRVSSDIENLRRTSRGWEGRVALYTDEEGYFGRRCPDSDCRAFFKLNTAQFDAAPESLRLTCPECGHEAHHERFMTSEQTRRGEAALQELGEAAADAILRDFSRRLGTQRFKGGHIEWKAHRNPPRRPRPIANYVEQATIRMFACPRGHSAVIYDLLAFCPWCGTDTPPRAVFADSLASQRRLLALIEDQPAEARADIEARGGVTALAERALTGAVAASQNLAKQLHGQRHKPAVKGNPWQNVDRLAKKWRQSFQVELLDGLDDATVRTLRLAFGRRHVLEHNGGVIDDDYVSQTGEGVLGRRIRIRLNFVEEAFAAIEKLADRLEMTAGERQD